MPFESEKLIAHVKRHLYPYVLLTIVVLFNVPVMGDLISDWYRDGNYSHGFLIIPISIYLFFRQSKQFTFPAKPAKAALALLAVGCVGLIFGIAATEYFTTRFSLVLIVTSVAWYHLGTSNFRKTWFAFFFLLFMIPVPAIIYYSATAPMQLFASKVTNTFLQVIGVPSLRQGNIIILPDYRLEVAEACSGLRSLMTLMALTSLYGYLRMPGKVVPVILFLATFPIAIATNIFRVVTTALGAYTISTSVAESFLHEVSGAMVFISALIMVIILGAILQWAKKRFS
jgi:exosortase